MSAMSVRSLAIDLVEHLLPSGCRQLVAMHDRFSVAVATQHCDFSGIPAYWVVGLTFEAGELLGYAEPFVVEAPAAARSALAMIWHLYTQSTVAA